MDTGLRPTLNDALPELDSERAVTVNVAEVPNTASLDAVTVTVVVAVAPGASENRVRPEIAAP